MNTDRIEKTILLRAPRERVWRALSDSTEFGTWFGVKFEGPFTKGATTRGVLVPTSVDAEIAAQQKPYEGMKCDLIIEQMEPERLFSFRWHPGAVEPGVNYASEPTTLVEFILKDAPEGVALTIVESGFDAIPLERRAKAFSDNEQGWAMMAGVIEKYVVHAP